MKQFACGEVGLAVLPDFLGGLGNLEKLSDDQPMSLRHSPAVRVAIDFLVSCFESFKV